MLFLTFLLPLPCTALLHGCCFVRGYFEAYLKLFCQILCIRYARVGPHKRQLENILPTQLVVKKLTINTSSNLHQIDHCKFV